MAWGLPSLPNVGDVATVAGWATKVINCLRYLKGLDGTVTLEDGLDLDTNELTINSIEIVGADGEVNKEAVEDHTHADGDNCGTIDHGVITGLGDDDHTIYQKENLFTDAGDMAYATGASAWAKLGKGTAGQYLKQAANAPEWAAGTGATVAETEVFNGAAPDSWTDLDLSGTIGSNATLVVLKLICSVSDKTVAFRKNGDTDDFHDDGSTNPLGVACVRPTTTTIHSVVLVATDTAGEIEWRVGTGDTLNIIVDIIAYSK